MTYPATSLHHGQEASQNAYGSQNMTKLPNLETQSLSIKELFKKLIIKKPQDVRRWLLNIPKRAKEVVFRLQHLGMDLPELIQSGEFAPYDPPSDENR